jgi:hypothetical protein
MPDARIPARSRETVFLMLKNFNFMSDRGKRSRRFLSGYFPYYGKVL